MNKTLLIQSIDRFIAVLALSWLLLVGSGGAQLIVAHSQEPAAMHIVQGGDGTGSSGLFEQEGNFWAG